MKRENNMMKSGMLLSVLVVLIITFWGCTCDDNEEDNNDVPQEVWADPTSGLMWQNAVFCCTSTPYENEPGYFSNDEALDYCKNLKWSGYKDWHLPSISELRSLIRGCETTETGGECAVTDNCNDQSCYGNACLGCPAGFGPGIYQQYWPFGLTETKIGRYVSKTIVQGGSGSEIWFIDFIWGEIFYKEPAGNQVRCVRDIKESHDNDDDDDFSEEVWEDSDSGLMWQDYENYPGEWDEAKSYCQNLEWGGFNGWRLPSISELRSLIRGCPETETGGACGVTDDCLDLTCWNSSCDGCSDLGGPGLNGYYSPIALEVNGYGYWSSSPVMENSDVAFQVSFLNGSIYDLYLYVNTHSRCVRDAD